MALRVVEQAGLTDVGRQREANEDNFVCGPLFAVADGMGGAQAGEVASRMAVDVLVRGDHDGGTPEERLTRVIRRANTQIHELAERDESRRGMGTTATAAIVEGRDVTVGHVGDSRAYRLRDGELEQLTRDHSLVAELVRSGQLSEEAAENHPQRSVITRALGPEAEVEVDAHSHVACDGDVYLLCSDGLTSMISGAEIAGILRAAGSLEEAARNLVRAANQSGGKDNITVVLFRVAEGPDGDDSAVGASPAVQETIHQGLTTDDVRSAVQEQERTAMAAPPSAPPRVTASRRSRPVPAREQPPSGPRRAARLLVMLVVAVAICAGLYAGARQVYFLGTDDAGLVTLYRGLPYELPMGIELYASEYTSSVPARRVPSARRERVLDHEWRSRGDAEDLVRQLERGTLDRGRARE
ncbi:MAG TPA: Stp1/IreP family PP2C-type Ser/Thr phosphatase [Thermoleophilaceae bacterium]|nr:Stp1/IreP family PP2C-type Ser/Thr phosphatase [Thermoleophilaceae bacterium]